MPVTESHMTRLPIPALSIYMQLLRWIPSVQSSCFKLCFLFCSNPRDQYSPWWVRTQAASGECATWTDTTWRRTERRKRWSTLLSERSISSTRISLLFHFIPGKRLLSGDDLDDFTTDQVFLVFNSASSRPIWVMRCLNTLVCLSHRCRWKRVWMHWSMWYVLVPPFPLSLPLVVCFSVSFFFGFPSRILEFRN